jgi:hypothetical protein
VAPEASVVSLDSKSCLPDDAHPDEQVQRKANMDLIIAVAASRSLVPKIVAGIFAGHSVVSVCWRSD